MTNIRQSPPQLVETTDVKTEPKKYTLGYYFNEVLTKSQYDSCIKKLKLKGVSKTTLNRIIYARQTDTYSPNVDTMTAISDVLNVPIEELITPKTA